MATFLTAASSPTYDPNKFVRGISVADYGLLRDNDRRPLASKAVQDAYPPGSTFKMVAALAALDAGLVSPDDTVWCPGHLEVSGGVFIAGNVPDMAMSTWSDRCAKAATYITTIWR